ncbi:MAG: hypothetical protein AB1489_34345 [Acidobacteriota bacterium]
MPVLIVLTIFAVVAVILILVAIKRSSAEDNLKQWVSEHGYKILQQEKRSARESPFSVSSYDRDQSYYYITVMDQYGQEMRGWVQCSGKFSALLGEKVEVMWDKS